MIKDELKKLIREAINKAQKSKKLPDFEIQEPNVEYPKEASHGDFASNVALLLANKVRKKPMELAEIIVKNFPKNKITKKVESAPPGFINFILSDELLQKQVKEILEQKEEFGSSKLGRGKKIQVEFISANPTGPLTLGNGRGGFFGDILSNILDKSGYKVEREYYINDAGVQIEEVGKLAIKILKDYMDKLVKSKATEETEARLNSFLGKQYDGPYYDELVKKFKDKYKDSILNAVRAKVQLSTLSTQDVNEYIDKATDFAVKNILSDIKKSVKSVGINFDNWFSEKSLQKNSQVKKAVELLKKKGFAYEKEGALWFKATGFGDNQDWVLKKSNGEFTYFASDIAYHLDKFEKRKFQKVIDIWGADHAAHVSKLKSAMKVFDYDKKLDILITQLVRLISKGKEVKISKRLGNIVTLDELVSEVGLDVARFFFVMRSINTHMDFDLTLAKEKSEKNPVYYVQYAYARIHGILEKIPNSKIQNPNLTLLKHPAELALIKELIKLPDLIKDIADDYQVQKVPYFAIDLASAFHQFYNSCRVITDDKDLSVARQSLVQATQIVLKNTLDVLGVSAPEKM